jgi:hypothetical protein
MHDHAPSVTNSLSYATHRDRIGKEIGLVSRPEEDLGKSEEHKHGDEEGIQAKIWCITIDRVLHRTVQGHLSAVLGDSMLHFES